MAYEPEPPEPSPLSFPVSPPVPLPVSMSSPVAVSASAAASVVLSAPSPVLPSVLAAVPVAVSPPAPPSVPAAVSAPPLPSLSFPSPPSIVLTQPAVRASPAVPASFSRSLRAESLLSFYNMTNCRLIHGMARSCIFRGCGRERASNPIPGFARFSVRPSVTEDPPVGESGRTPLPWCSAATLGVSPSARPTARNNGTETPSADRFGSMESGRRGRKARVGSSPP
jgi:hypothetical protein